MTISEALQILDGILAKVVGTRQDHDIIKDALALLQDLVEKAADAKPN